MIGQMSYGNSRSKAIVELRGANWVVKACGGYMGFEYEQDYLRFVKKPQKRHKVIYKKFPESADCDTKL